MEKRSKTETEQFYRDLLAEHARSGLSTRAFAAQRGMPAGTLMSWRHKLKVREAAAGLPEGGTESFVPVNIVPSGARPISSSATGYEVVVGVVRFPGDFDEARVAALVRAVASC